MAAASATPTAPTPAQPGSSGSVLVRLRRPGWPMRIEFASPPQPAEAQALDGLSDASLRDWPTERIADLALEVERAALDADSRIAAVETAVYADSAERVAIASSTGVAGEFEVSSAYAYLQALAEGEGGRETGLGFGLARGPAELDPVAIGEEGASRAAAMIGAAQARFALLSRDPRPDRRRQLRRPDRRDPGRRFGAARPLAVCRAARARRSPARPYCCTTTGCERLGPASSPFDGEGVPRRRTTLIEGGRLLTYLHDTYTARRAGVCLNRQRGAQRLSLRSPRSRPPT